MTASRTHRTRRWYGFEHKHGPEACDGNGYDLGTCYAFPSRETRDAWVRGDARRTAYSSAQARKREVLPYDSWGAY